MSKNARLILSIVGITLGVFVFALVFLAGYLFGQKGAPQEPQDHDYMELKDLVDSISLPEDEDWTVHDTWILARPNTKVHWLDDGPSEAGFYRCCSGLGDVGRKGNVKVRIDGKVTTEDLNTVVTETPWSIGWSGTLKFVTAVYLDIVVNIHDMDLDVPGYLEKLGWAKRMDIDSTLYDKCSNSWYEIKIPHRKKMWMNVVSDLGNGYGMYFITFTFEDLSDSDVCKNIYGDEL